MRTARNLQRLLTSGSSPRTAGPVVKLQKAGREGMSREATAYHEAIEAVRWARSLLASGEADPADIAIAGASTAEYDDHFLSLRAGSRARQARHKKHTQPKKERL